jgi:hypothetical protein
VQADWKTAAVPIWNNFDLRQIACVSKVVKSIDRSRDGIKMTFEMLNRKNGAFSWRLEVSGISGGGSGRGSP